MNDTKLIAALRSVAGALVVLAVVGCSKTVTWEEEVPLNTGDTIWVTRTDTFKRATQPGNPFKWGWWITNRAIDLRWKEQRFAFELNTIDIFMVYPRDTGISVVAWSTQCAKRGYAEFRWTNGLWRMQRTLDPLLITHRRNLMSYYSAEAGDIPSRATTQYKRNSRFELPQNGAERTYVAESQIAVNCMETP